MAYDLGTRTTVYDGGKEYELTEPKKTTESFFIGLFLATDDQINLKIRHRQEPIEYGRVVGHALKVRGYFRNHEKLGLSALRLDNPFFGNQPEVDPRSKVIKNPLVLQTQIGLVLSDKWALSVYHALASMFEQKAFTGFESEHVNAAIKDNLLSYQTIIDHYRRRAPGESRPKNRASKRTMIGKLPERPTQSPLLLKEEFDVIDGLLEPIWTAFDYLQRDYQKTVFQRGYKVVIDLISTHMIIKWKIIENFSSITTKRLSAIRKIAENAKLLKRSITVDMVEELLRSRTRPYESFVMELGSLFKGISESELTQIKPSYTREGIDNLCRSLILARRPDLTPEFRRENKVEKPIPFETENPYAELGKDKPDFRVEDTETWVDWINPTVGYTAKEGLLLDANKDLYIVEGLRAKYKVRLKELKARLKGILTITPDIVKILNRKDIEEIEALFLNKKMSVEEYDVIFEALHDSGDWHVIKTLEKGGFLLTFSLKQNVIDAERKTASRHI